VYLLVDPRFLPPPFLKFLQSIALRSPIGWTPLTDNGQRDASLRPSVLPSLRWLNGRARHICIESDVYSNKSNKLKKINITFNLQRVLKRNPYFMVFYDAMRRELLSFPPPAL